MIVVTISAPTALARLEQLRNVAPQKTSAILRTHAKRMFSDVVDDLPPRTLDQGRGRVAADLRKAVRPLRATTFTVPRFRKLVQTHDLRALNAISSKAHSEAFGNLSIVRFTSALHQTSRDPSSGRVLGAHRVATTDANLWDAYLRRRQANVGLLKGAFSAPLKALGSFSGFSSANASTVSSLRIVRFGPKPSISLTCSLSYASNYDRVFAKHVEAFRRRFSANLAAELQRP